MYVCHYEMNNLCLSYCTRTHTWDPSLTHNATHTRDRLLDIVGGGVFLSLPGYILFNDHHWAMIFFIWTLCRDCKIDGIIVLFCLLVYIYIYIHLSLNPGSAPYLLDHPSSLPPLHLHDITVQTLIVCLILLLLWQLINITSNTFYFTDMWMLSVNSWLYNKSTYMWYVPHFR